MRKIILFSALILFYFSSQAQDFSNKGKDFWVGYGYHERMGQANGGTQDMVLYFATDQVTHITISIPGNGYTQNITTAAGYNVITSATIPKNGTQDARLNVEGLSNKGIHITSDRPMVAYAHIYNASVSGATILFPTNTLGKEYYSVNYKNWSNTTNSNCWFYVVAVDTGTTYVEITPTGNTTGGWVAGNTYTVSLTQGQIYNVMGAMTINSNCGGNNQSPCTSYDLTGSLVKSVSNGTSCKKIGVFSGSGRISITCTSFGSSSDNYMAQNVPKSAWGKKYLTASASGNSQNNIYRVCVPDPTTIVRINGVITPIAGFYYEIASTSAPQLIEADKPILVAQYFTSQGACGNGTPGDPEVIYLSPVEQSIKDILWNATPFNAITQQYFNVVIPNSGTAISSFRLYNSVGTQLPTNAFIVHPQDPNYSYLKQQLPGSGVYRVVSDSGFNAIAYGFGSAESYGYNAGTNVKDLYQQIGVQTTWGIETTPSVCTNTPFKFKVSLPYCADSIKWNLSNLPGPPAAPPTAVYPTCASADSSTIVNGKPIYWYSLPSLYSFSSIGTYPVTITTYFPTSECGGTQDIDFDLQISDPPLPSFTEVLPGCYAEPVQFIETTPQTPKPTYTWYWDFGDGNTSTGKNPTHTYAAPGTYYVRYASITTPGCLSDTIGHSITITDLPKATVSGTTAVCLNAASPVITFTGTDGAAPYEFSYTINGVAQTPVISNAAGSYTINVPTNIAGPFTYAITSVKNAGSTLCVRPINNQQVTVTVNPLPQAAIAGATTVCLNAPSPPITFTGSGGTAPYTFAYTINGVAQTPVVSNAGGTYTVNAPTNVAGTFVYSITTVTDASSTLCNQSYNNTVTTTVTVKPLPTASVTGSATTVCLNAASPQITFTGSTGTAPYTFSYTLNGVPQTPVVSNAAGTYTINVPTTAVGPQIYVITNVQESSANTCSQAITGQSYTVTVNPLPQATIAGATAVCLNAASPQVIFTGSGGTAPYTFAYTINGVAQTPVVSNAGGTYTINAPTNVAGTFVYSITTVTDASSTLCNQSYNNTVTTTITIRPLPTPDFITTAPLCETRDISFTDNSNPQVGSVTNWSWNFGDPGSGTLNNNSILQNPVHNFSTAGNYLITLNVTTNNGCSNAVPFTRTITINDRPKAGFIVPEVCINDVAAVFIDTSKIANGAISGAGYEWNYGDPPSGINNTSFLKDGSHLYTLVGPYNVTHVVTSTLGCKDTVMNPIFINGANPVANFSVSNPTTLCSNDSVAITNLSTIGQGSITKVEIYWDWIGAPATVQVDDFPAPNKVYRHKYLTFQAPLTKPYTIRFVAYSGTLCLDTKNTSIIVNAAPKVQFNNMPDVCYDAAPFLITQGSEVGGVPGTFAYSGPGIVNPNGLFNPVASGVGTHTIKYTFTSSAAGCVDSASKTITVLDTASSKFSFLTPICEGSSTTFKEESTAPAGVTLSNTIWNFGDGSPLENHAPGTSFTHTYASWGSYNVTMYNTSAYGCKSKPVTKAVYVSPIPNAVFAFGQSSVCIPNADVSFINNSTIADGTENAFTYMWDMGDPSSGISNASVAKTPPPHHYTGTGPYTVSLTVTSGTGCAKTTTKNVDFIHPQPKTAFNFSKPSVCIGDNVVMTDITNGLDGTINQWFWKFSDGGTDNKQQVIYTFGAPKTYDVSLYTINSNGCNSDTLTKQFTVYAYPTVDAGPDRVVLEGGAITIEPIVTGNGLQYLWTPATYLNSTTIEKPTANNILDDITYTLTVTGEGGCTALPDKMFVKVLKMPKVPNTFTPNGDGINDTWIIQYLETYPNCKVQVFTRTGQLVFESRGYKTPWDGRYNGKALPFDTYYYIIEPENGRKPVTGYVTIVK